MKCILDLGAIVIQFTQIRISSRVGSNLDVGLTTVRFWLYSAQSCVTAAVSRPSDVNIIIEFHLTEYAHSLLLIEKVFHMS